MMTSLKTKHKGKFNITHLKICSVTIDIKISTEYISLKHLQVDI